MFDNINNRIDFSDKKICCGFKGCENKLCDENDPECDECIDDFISACEDEHRKLYEQEPTFVNELSDLINRYSMENGSDTPDFIIADYLKNCLMIFDRIMKLRDDWYSEEEDEDEGVELSPHYIGLPDKVSY